MGKQLPCCPMIEPYRPMGRSAVSSMEFHTVEWLDTWRFEEICLSKIVNSSSAELEP